MDKKLHHANVIASKIDCRDFVFGLLKNNLDFDVKANPDFLLLESESFGIDDSRNLKVWVSGKSFGEMKVSLIVTKSITFEAQNALLKVLEEPPAGTYIFVNLQNLGGLLPTFMSRVMVLVLPDSEKHEEEIKSNESKFLHSDISGKLSIVRALSKNADKTKMKELLRNLEEIAYKDYSENKTGAISAKNMKNILTAKIFAYTRGSSPKMLLEWLSCVL